MKLLVLINETLPPDGWRAIAEIAVALIGLFTALFVRKTEKKQDKKKAVKAIKTAVKKTKDGFEVIPEKELE